jgi:uncharacterized membrane protein HdeD (DUF308 family)
VDLIVSRDLKRLENYQYVFSRFCSVKKEEWRWRLTDKAQNLFGVSQLAKTSSGHFLLTVRADCYPETYITKPNNIHRLIGNCIHVNQCRSLEFTVSFLCPRHYSSFFISNVYGQDFLSVTATKLRHWDSSMEMIFEFLGSQMKKQASFFANILPTFTASLQISIMTTESTPLHSNGESEDAAYSLLYLDTIDEIQENWKWILTVGILNLFTGLACLICPWLATQVSELMLVGVIFFSGVLNATAVCFRNSESLSTVYRNHIFLLGIGQIVLAVIMFNHPNTTLTILTLMVAIIFMGIGSLQMAATREQHNLAARGLLFLSGGLTILLSVGILIFMPISRWITIGVLIGTNLINLGSTRIILAFYGRSLSKDDRATNEQWRYYMEANLS